MNLRPQLLKLCAKYHFRQSHALDQYFMIDFGIIERMVRYAEITREDTVLEIGPGPGFLTKELAKRAGRVIAVEKDRRLEKLLTSELSEYNNITFVFQDYLKTQVPEYNKTVSNIPFSSSSDIIMKIVQEAPDLAVLTFQKEFAEKLLADPGWPGYGHVSVITQYYYEGRIKETVPRGAFHPMPKVDAAVVILKKKDIAKDKGFEEFVKQVFRHPNKNIGRVVQDLYGKELADERKVRSLSPLELKGVYNRIS